MLRAVRFVRHNRLFAGVSFTCTRTISDLTTHYDTLGLKKEATNQEVKDAFVNLSKKFHPDKTPGNPANQKRFVEVSEAYNVLSKPLLRKEYDEKLLRSRYQYRGSIPKSPPPTKQWREFEDAADSEAYFEFRKRYYGKTLEERESLERMFWRRAWERKANQPPPELPKLSDRHMFYLILSLFWVSFYFITRQWNVKKRPPPSPQGSWNPEQENGERPRKMSVNQFVIEQDLGLIDKRGRRIRNNYNEELLDEKPMKSD